MWRFAEIPGVEPWDPSQGDLWKPHGVYPQQPSPGQPAQYPSPETPQELTSAGWSSCPKCHNFWIDPDTKAKIEATGGYFTCPRCRQTSLLLDNLPWHGVEEPDYYPRGKTGGGTAIGLPMEDVGQIAENIVQKMGEIPGYGPIVWWHPGGAAGKSPLDAATAEWGIEVKAQVYDAASHYWHPGDKIESQHKNEAAEQMGLKGVLGVYVVENFRTDTADVYIKEMPHTPWLNNIGRPQQGVAKWHKSTGTKVATGIPFPNPYKDPNSPSPGPYSLSNFYEKPRPADFQPAEPAPF